MVRDCKCPYCKVNDNVVKLGTTFNGRKRFGCKKCKKSFYAQTEPIIKFKDGSTFNENPTEPITFELGKVN